MRRLVITSLGKCLASLSTHFSKHSLDWCTAYFWNIYVNSFSCVFLSYASLLDSWKPSNISICSVEITGTGFSCNLVKSDESFLMSTVHSCLIPTFPSLWEELANEVHRRLCCKEGISCASEQSMLVAVLFLLATITHY